MTAWRLALRLLRRGLAQRRAATCWRPALALTVAAITAVAFFGDRVERAMQRQGGELIAADLAVDDGHPIPADLRRPGPGPGPGQRGDAGVPQRGPGRGGDPTGSGQGGRTRATRCGGPTAGAGPTPAPRTPPPPAGPAPGEAWAEARLLPLLGLRRPCRGRGGDRPRRDPPAPDPSPGLRARPRRQPGPARPAAPGQCRGHPRHRPGHPGQPGALPPAGGRGRRAGGRASAPGPRGACRRNAQVLDPSTPGPELATAIAGATRFLRLATLVTLLVAGAAIALASRRLVERQTDAVAVMRCLGAPRHLLTRVFVLRLLAFGLAVSLVGVLLGYAAQQGLVALVGDLFAQDLPPPSAAPIAVGLVTGLVALLGFALPPLIQLARVPPLRALRRDLGTPRASVLGATLAAAAALALLIWWQAGDAQLAARLLAGAGRDPARPWSATVVILIRLAAWFQPRTRGVWRLGLAGPDPASGRGRAPGRRVRGRCPGPAAPGGGAAWTCCGPGRRGCRRTPPTDSSSTSSPRTWLRCATSSPPRAWPTPGSCPWSAGA